MASSPSAITSLASVASTVVYPTSQQTSVPLVTPASSSLTTAISSILSSTSSSLATSQLTTATSPTSSYTFLKSPSSLLTTAASTLGSIVSVSTPFTCSPEHPENCHVSPTTPATTTFPTTSTKNAASDPQQHNQHNQSPITVYTETPRPFKPDRLAKIDLIIIVIYLCLILSTSISTWLRTKYKEKAGSGKGKGGARGPIAASRKMNWFTVGASIFASNMGSEHFIGLSGSAAANGLSVGAFEMNALIILQISTWIFLPVLIVSKISTLPEYMQKRFGGKRIRTYLAVLSILLYIFTKISVNLFSGGIFIQQAIGWNLYTSAMFVLAITAIMTMTGGARGAMLIDQGQAWIMTLGASFVATKALSAVGGWQGLQHRYTLAVPTKVPANLTHCAQPNPRAFQMLRPWDDKDMPWIGFIIGQTPGSIWYWAADQMMVQRLLSARSLAHAQGSAIFAGYLKILPLIFMVIPGMISRCLYADEVGCIDPIECKKYCQSTVSCSNTAYPRLVLELLPMGVRGMMVATMVAALIGDLCNVFNSASALFTCDIWPLFRKNASSNELLTVGRLFVVFLVMASIMWIPVIQEMQGGQLFIYIQAVSALFAPPIAAVYIFAILWKRTNETAAFWSLMIGFALGLYRMVLSFMYKDPSCGQLFDNRPWILKHVHYMYYAAFLFCVTIASTVLISLFTKPPAAFRLIRTTYWTRFDTNIRTDDKNVYEMKYSSKSGGGEANGSSRHAGTHSEQSERLFTIDDKDSGHNSAVSLSAQDSIVVSMDEAVQKAEENRQKKLVKESQPSAAAQQQHPKHSPTLQHQLSGTGKFLVSKLASVQTEVNLKGAKDIMKAAASHLTGAAQSSQIKFKNLRGDEDDDDDDQDAVSDSDDESGAVNTKRRLSARDALNAYGNKKKGGYKKAPENDSDDEEEEDDDYDDDDYDDEDDEDDDDTGERRTLNKAASFKGTPRKDPLSTSSSATARKSPKKKRPTTSDSKQLLISTGIGGKRKSGGARDSSRKSRKKVAADDDYDLEAAGALSRYKCLDNSVALLIKTRLEERMLRSAVAAISLVCIGIFILFSIPPAPPRKDLVDMLIQN